MTDARQLEDELTRVMRESSKKAQHIISLNIGMGVGLILTVHFSPTLAEGDDLLR